MNRPTIRLRPARGSDHRWKWFSAAAVLGLLVSGSAAAQVTDLSLPHTDKTVRALAVSGDTLFVGGDFTMIGPYTGPSAAVDVVASAVIASQANYTVYAVVSDGSGGWFLGGAFSSVGGQPRSCLAHIQADGSLATWSPAVTAFSGVFSMALSGTTLYIGGSFSSVGGQPRSGLAAVDAVSGAVLPWNPSANFFVRTLAVQGSVVYVGGNFTTIGGQSRTRIAAIDATTGVPTAWDPHGNGDVMTIAPAGGVVYVGGDFTAIGDALRNRIAALDVTTGLATAWNPNADQPVSALAIQGTTVYAGGQFTTIGGAARSRLAALDAGSNDATPWNPAPGSPDHPEVRALVADGTTVWVGGLFTTIGGEPRGSVAAIDAVTGAATAWQGSATGTVQALARGGQRLFVGSDGKLIGCASHRYLAAVDLAHDTVLPWEPKPDGPVNSLVATGPVVYAGGGFSTIGGESRNSLAAIDRVSGLATSWNPAIQSGDYVQALELVGSQLYVGGKFASIGGQARSNLAAIAVSDASASPWNPNVNGRVDVVKYDEGRVYVGGFFTGVGPNPRNNLAAINATTGAAVPGWRPDPNDVGVYCIVVHGSRVYFGGGFNSVAGVGRQNVAAVDKVTGALSSWYPGPHSLTYAIAAVGPLVLVGGGGADPRDTTSAMTQGWTVPNANGTTYALAVDSPFLYVGGSFDQSIDTPRLNLLRLRSLPLVSVRPPLDAGLDLAQSAPNPATEATTFSFSLPRRSAVTLRIHDVMGRSVATPLDRVTLDAGSHQRSVSLARLANGLYFYSLSVGDRMLTHRLVVAR